MIPDRKFCHHIRDRQPTKGASGQAVNYEPKFGFKETAGWSKHLGILNFSLHHEHPSKANRKPKRYRRLPWFQNCWSGL